MSTYVYGIARTSHPHLPEKMDGVGDPPCPVRIIEAGKLAALVSDAPEGLKPKRRDLLAHQKVLAEAGAAGAVLPMRFGGISHDDDAVTAVLTEHEDQFLERLQSLEGRVEYNVKVTHNEQAVLEQVLADSPELRALSEANRGQGGGSYQKKLQLGELVVSAVKRREAIDAAIVEQALADLVESISHGPESGGWLANISFLVDREHSDRFLAAVEGLQREHPRIVLQLNGPLPPYSFAD